jgi:hypothetical protein
MAILNMTDYNDDRLHTCYMRAEFRLDNIDVNVPCLSVRHAVRLHRSARNIGRQGT